MSKLMLLIKQLYKQKITSKSFIFMTLFYLAIIAAVINWSSIKDLFASDDDQVKIALVDRTDAKLQTQFPTDNQIDFKAVKQSDAEVKKSVKDGKYDAALFLSDKDKQLVASLATSAPLDLSIQSSVSNLVETAGKVYSVQQLNLSSDQAQTILETMTVVKQIDLSEDTSTKSAEQKQAGIFVAYIVGFFIYLFVTSYLSMITTDIASEKGSRVLEVLMASIKPSTHMISKIIGVFLTGMTQFILLIAGGILIIKLSAKGDTLSGFTEMVNELSISYLIYVLIFFILSVLLFLIIGALAGSLVSKVEEASQVMMPGILVTLVGFYVLISGIANPDTIFVKVFSYIPFTSGMVMTLRLGATDVSTMSVLLSLGILIITVIAFFILSLSFYKRSVLTYSSGGVIQKIKTVLKVTT